MNDKIRKAININNPFVFKHISNLKVERRPQSGCCLLLAGSERCWRDGNCWFFFRVWIILTTSVPAWWWRLQVWCRAACPESCSRAGALIRGTVSSSLDTVWREPWPRSGAPPWTFVSQVWSFRCSLCCCALFAAHHVRARGDHHHVGTEAAAEDVRGLHLLLGSHRLPTNQRIHQSAQTAARGKY